MFFYILERNQMDMPIMILLLSRGVITTKATKAAALVDL